MALLFFLPFFLLAMLGKSSSEGRGDMKPICGILLLSCALIAPSAMARGGQGGGHGGGNPHMASPEARHEKHERAERQEREREGSHFSVGVTLGEVRGFAREAGVPPGRYHALPPGMRNRLAQGKRLPPGIAKKQVPPAMLARLPVHPGHEWAVIGVDLVLINSRTRVSVDIFPGVF